MRRRLPREDDRSMRHDVLDILHKETSTLAVVELSKPDQVYWSGTNYETCTYYYLVKLAEKIVQNKELIPLGVLKSLFDVRVLHKDEKGKWVNQMNKYNYPYLDELRKYVADMMEDYL